MITHEEMIRLFQVMASGTDEEKQEAKDKLVSENIPLSVSIAIKYEGRGIPHDDLLQEAKFGLIQAVNTFDITQANRFSTYATRCIENRLKTALAKQSSLIKIPARKFVDARKLKHTAERLQLISGHTPGIRELAEELNFSEDYVQELLLLPEASGNLDTPIGEDGDTTLGDLIADNKTPTPEELAFQKLLQEQMREALHSLTPMEEQVLCLRFGLDDNQPRQTADVAVNLSLPEDRVYDITVKALRKLWHPSRAKKLTTRRRD